MTRASSLLDMDEKWRAGRGIYRDGAEPYTSDGSGTDTVAAAAGAAAAPGTAGATEALVEKGLKPGGAVDCAEFPTLSRWQTVRERASWTNDNVYVSCHSSPGPSSALYRSSVCELCVCMTVSCPASVLRSPDGDDCRLRSSSSKVSTPATGTETTSGKAVRWTGADERHSEAGRKTQPQSRSTSSHSVAATGCRT